MSINERMIKVVKKAIDFEGDSISIEEDFFDGSLSLDSIDMLEIVLGIKKEFGVQISLDKGQTPGFRNIKELSAVVEEALSQEALVQ